MDHPTIQHRHRVIVAFLASWLLLASPAAAQGPIDASGGTSLYDQIVAALGPVQDFLKDYADLVDAPATATEDIWGSQLFSTAATGEGPGTGSPPAEYYPDAPEQVRTAGYTLEGLTTADISSMSALDFAHWLGVALALPFEFVRGLQDIGDIIGPFGVFLAWLFFAALWVGIIYFLSFLISFVKNIINLGGKILQVIEVFKP